MLDPPYPPCPLWLAAGAPWGALLASLAHLKLRGEGITTRLARLYSRVFAELFRSLFHKLFNARLRFLVPTANAHDIVNRSAMRTANRFDLGNVARALQKLGAGPGSQTFTEVEVVRPRQGAREHG